MSKLIMGIDGGGTKSHLGLFDLHGKCLSIKAHGPLNHEQLTGSFTQLEEEMGQFIHSALESIGASINDTKYTVIGLAGVDTKEQHTIISAIMGRIGLKDFILCNDGYLGVSAGCPGGVGICAINGTGSVLTAIDASGYSQQVGGIGHFTDDRGGSGWYGTQVLAPVYSQLFKSGPATALTQMVFSQLNITHRDMYTEAITAAMQDNSFNIFDMNRLLFVAAGDGDAISIDILKDSAEHYARCIEYLAKNMDFPVGETLYVTLAGSVFVKEKVKVLPDLLKARVDALLGAGKVEFITLDVPPVAGAVMWAFREAGICVDAALIKEAFAVI
ncbi:MAG: hypothetical protein FWE42_01650 [Defluviitaleaceae bacterium]|nr:hypothetical protein [Defluviitaleaceae bacterium]